MLSIPLHSLHSFHSVHSFHSRTPFTCVRSLSYYGYKGLFWSITIPLVLFNASLVVQNDRLMARMTWASSHDLMPHGWKIINLGRSPPPCPPLPPFLRLHLAGTFISCVVAWLLVVVAGSRSLPQPLTGRSFVRAFVGLFVPSCFVHHRSSSPTTSLTSASVLLCLCWRLWGTARSVPPTACLLGPNQLVRSTNLLTLNQDAWFASSSFVVLGVFATTGGRMESGQCGASEFKLRTTCFLPVGL